jgi:stage IV sporulation protein B
MAKKIRLIIFLGIFTLSLVILSLNMEALTIYTLPDELPISFSDVEEINNSKPFGRNISAHVAEKSVTVGGEKSMIKTLVFKLFGFLPIKTLEANIIEDSEVFVGGAPVGFAIDVDGLIVIGGNSVVTESGMINTFESSGLKKGDLIIAVNGKRVSSIDDVRAILESENFDGKELSLTLIRNKEEVSATLTPAFDSEEKKYKIGLWVRNEASGVGTLTYIDCEDMRFGALGHPITDYETGIAVPAKGGKLFSCNVVGLNKGEKGVPGEIKGVFMQGKNNKGTIEKNSPFGVFGTITDKDKLVDINKTADIGSRLTMKPGKATLVSNISGVREEYEIEIIKANYQPSSSDKSFVFRVTDPRLLDLTGGIIQGMSGSPILQNGKIVGAVTHVFVSDPTKGYGVYVDWMVAA